MRAHQLWGVGVVAGGAARCPSSEAEMYGSDKLGIAQMSALGSSEASAPQGFKCISIMGDSNGGSTTVRSRGGVLSREGPFSEVPLYYSLAFCCNKSILASMYCNIHIYRCCSCFVKAPLINSAVFMLCYS